MQLIPTGQDLGDLGYPAFIKACNLDPGEFNYSAPLRGFGDLQFYVNFGSAVPSAVQITAVSLCTDQTSEQIFTANYVASVNPAGDWYGVWKFFNTTVTQFRTFVVHLSATLTLPDTSVVQRSWFSQALEFETCDPLVKIKACMPEGDTELGFDINGVYYGLPDAVDYLGMPTIRYFNIAYVRKAKVRETGAQITFKQSLTRSFNTVLERTYTLVMEYVPQWYKDVILAIYTRGAIEVNGVQWLVSELAFEALDDDDIMWKPYALLKKTNKLYYGCDESVCIECCSPMVTAASVTVITCECEPEVIGATVEIVPGGGDWAISYTNVEEIPVYLGYHNGGAGPLTDLYDGPYVDDPTTGTDPGLPAVDALVVFQIFGGKTFVNVTCNGVPNPAAVGNSVSTWLGVNGNILINFITD